jgi:hypothetical protein
MHFRRLDVNNVDCEMDARVEQRVIIKFLSNEGADPTEVHHKLLRNFQEDVYTVSSAYEWI